jgi:hypothetical protein
METNVMDKEYIEIDKNTFPTPYKNILNDFMRGWNVCLNSVLQHKTADVEPVRHARWIKITKPQKSNEGFFYWNAIPKTIYFCSYCGRRESIKEPYCHCGAKMDGKDCKEVC